MSLRRTAAVVRKELLHIVRDPRNLFLVTAAPALLLFLLSYIFSFDVTQIRLAVLDLDRSSLSRHYLANLTADGDLVVAATAAGYDQILPLLTAGQADAGLVIPPGFDSDLRSGRTVQVQAIVDGTDPFASGQVISSLEARSGVFAPSVSPVVATASAAPLEVRTRVWYNAALKSLLSMVPGLLAVVLLMPSVAFVLALARETETGTLEGLIATPVSGADYLAGKLIAYVLAGLVSAVLALLVAVLWFKVPFRGSLVNYLLLVAIYFLACMAAAVVIAHLVRSQQTAMFVFLLIFLVPSFFLSGLITPVATTSWASMLTAYALPSTHFLEISRALFLKGLGLPSLARPALMLLVMAFVGLGAGLVLFRKKVR
jgi:ABC-2 type transport system permease protein